MKKFLFLISLFLIALSLYAQQEPLMKIYLDDGSTKQYNLKEIDSLGIIDNKNFYDMKIHYQDSLIAYYPTEIIGSIKFETDTNNNKVLNVYLFGYPKTYILSSIDSIIFYKDIYQPLTIGSQVWMLKNLNVDHYRNGDSIPEVINDSIWWYTKSGGWCYFMHIFDNGMIYGKLYNWFAVDDKRGLAPEGWHVASDSEWIKLEIFLGMPQNEAYLYSFRGKGVGGKLKVNDTIHWNSLNQGSTNESAFSAFAGGLRVMIGWFYLIGGCGTWWTSTKDIASSAYAIYREIDSNNDKISRTAYYRCYGHSVRCIKDN